MSPTTDGVRVEPETGRARPGMWRWLPAAATALVVLGALGAGTWWLTHPERFVEAGDGTEFDQGASDVAVGIHHLSGQDGEVVIRDVTATVTRNDAGATFEAKRCTLDPGLGFGAIGTAGVEDLSTMCTDLVDAAGATLSLDEADRQQLLLLIHAPGSGRVEINGVHVTYRDGVRWGAEDTGPDVLLP
ncbi:hypothetical protein KIN34_03600 [Cellulomonas sp. DKR-3]|uniref:GerMN domain-containing protein n=1 Tax=Cellulomonas fulva TaxID=2835530 RepID=A0ABS5TW77_9CELL|nr:hypothetical protein [Cellulomonas fulva]MBT0993369.1 hypothetical protein [Cellulomonas fulva]